MSFVLYTKELNGDLQEVIEHNLNTTTLLVTVWQNGYTISPNVWIRDENSVVVYGILGEARIVIGGVSNVPQGKQEVKHGEEEQGDGASGSGGEPDKPARRKSASPKRSAKGSRQSHES
jgi:hypothetical protein